MFAGVFFFLIRCEISVPNTWLSKESNGSHDEQNETQIMWIANRDACGEIPMERSKKISGSV